MATKQVLLVIKLLTITSLWLESRFLSIGSESSRNTSSLLRKAATESSLRPRPSCSFEQSRRTMRGSIWNFRSNNIHVISSTNGNSFMLYLLSILKTLKSKNLAYHFLGNYFLIIYHGKIKKNVFLNYSNIFLPLYHFF